MKEIDMEQLGVFMRMKPTLEDCAAFFKCSPDIIERRIRDHADLTFAEFRAQNMVHTRFNLIRSAIQKAQQSDTMHIFCLKNLCDWKDKSEIENQLSGNITSQVVIELPPKKEI